MGIWGSSSPAYMTLNKQPVVTYSTAKPNKRPTHKSWKTQKHQNQYEANSTRRAK